MPLFPYDFSNHYIDCFSIEKNKVIDLNIVKNL